LGVAAATAFSGIIIAFMKALAEIRVSGIPLVLEQIMDIDSPV
jgi:hypothetical protein